MKSLRLPRLGLAGNHRLLFWGLLFDEGAVALYHAFWAIYIASLGASASQIGFVIGVEGVVGLLGLVSSGYLADRIPPHRLILFAKLALPAGLLLASFAQTWWQVLPGAMLMALAMVGYPSISRVIDASSEDSAERLRAFNLIYNISPSIAFLIAPMTAGLIAEQLGLRVIFWVSILLAGLAALNYARLQPIRQPADGVQRTGYRAALAVPSVRLVCLLMLSTVFVIPLGMILMPVYLEEVRTIPYLQIGFYLSLASVGSIILGLFVNRSPRFRHPGVVMSLAMTTKAAGLLLILVGGSNFALLGLGFILTGGSALAWPVFYTLMSEATTESTRARGYALAEISNVFGFSAGPFAAGWLYEIQPSAPILTALLLLGPMLVLAVVITRSVRARSAAESPVPLDEVAWASPIHRELE
jgi:MFS family permease